MIDERKAFAMRFRDAAEQFEKSANVDRDALDLDSFGRLCLREHGEQDKVGELVIAAYHRGLLAVPGLAELVNWVENPPPDPEIVPGRQTPCICVPCPANLFSEVCGFHEVPVRILGGGKAEIVGDHIGGLLPKLLDNSPALHRPRQDQNATEQTRTKFQHQAMACRMLADEVERTSKDDARDCWIYEQARVGRKWQWIAENIPEWYPDREQITSGNGAKKAAIRFAEKHGLPEVKPRQHGRPEKLN